MKRIVAIICFTLWGLTPKTQTVGIIDYEAPLDLGYILFAPNSNKFVYLIDPCGYKINEWSMPSVPGMIAKLNNQGELIYAQRESSLLFSMVAESEEEYFRIHGMGSNCGIYL